MGTPHRGAGLAEWASLLARSVGLVKQTNANIVKVLRRESEVLALMQDNFFNLMRARDQESLSPIQVTCFFEELPVPGIGTVKRPSSTSSAKANIKCLRLFRGNPLLSQGMSQFQCTRTIWV